MATIHCNTFAELQAAVNTGAAAGDTITLNAGATYTGNLTIPNRSLASMITIKTNAAPGDLPAAGVRVDPSYLPFLATIQSTNTVPIITCARGANHFTFMGIHFPPKPNGFGNLIDMGADMGTGSTLADVCTDMAFDRCVFRGSPIAGQLRAVNVGVTRFRFENNYCDRFGAQGQQSNILAFQNGEGEHDIHNNFFSGSTQCIIYGGATVHARVSASVVSATNSSATLTDTTDLRVGQIMAFLAQSGTRRRWPKCLSVNHSTKFVTFETQDVVPDIPGNVRWGVQEKGIRISRNHFSHDLNVVLNGVLMPTTGVSTAVISGSFGPGSPVYQVQGYGTGYTGQEARGAASAATAPVAVVQDQGVRITYTPVTYATSHYVYRTLGGIITRFTTGTSGTFDDVGTGGTVVSSVPRATTFVGWIGIEFKNGIDVHFHSNVIENTYKGGFGGEGVLTKSVNQLSTAPFLTFENGLIENNVMRHSFSFGSISGSEAQVFTMDIQPKPLDKVTFRNNLLYDSDSANLSANEALGQSRYGMIIGNGAKNVQYIHNTICHQGTGAFLLDWNERGNLAGLLIRDNMLRGNGYLVASSNGFGATGLTNATTPGTYTFSYNACAPASNTISHVTGNNNQYAANLAAWEAEFVDSTGSDIADFALVGGSTYENDASDGTDIGADIPAIEAAVDGVVAGEAGPSTPAPVIVTSVLPPAVLDTDYDQTLAVSGGEAPLAWTMTSGTLPYGLALEGYATAVAETSGLLGFWRLGEPSGTIAYDHMGGPDGTYINAPTLNTTGTLTDGNKAVTFNGTDEHVYIGNVSTLRPSAAVSIEAIIKPATVTGTRNIGGVGGASVGYCLRMSGSEARFVVNGVTASVAGLAIGTTYHLVGTYDGANVRLYVNGTSSSPAALTGAINYGGDTDFLIAQRHGTASAQWFSGVIEEVAVYDVALSGATVTAHNAARTAATGANLRGIPVLEGTYTFDIRVTDNAAAQDTQALTLEVAEPVPVPVIVTTSPMAEARIDVAYSVTLVATDGTPPYSWSVTGGELPAGLNLDVDTGVISGTPTGSPSTAAFDVMVQDADGVVSLTRAFTMTVQPAVADPPVTGRNVKENSQESIIFRRLVANTPTAADLVDSGDILITYGPGLEPEPFLSRRTGTNISWRKWPLNETRVREIAVEEQAPILAKTTYIPTWTAASGTPAIGNGSLTGVYSQVGKLVTFSIRLLAGSTTTFGTSGDWTFTLPLTAEYGSAGSAYALDSSPGNNYSAGIVFPTATTVQVIASTTTYYGTTTPFTWETSDQLIITGSYWTA